MNKPRLISFKICPFAQRSALLLIEKNIAFDLDYINPDSPPEWFATLSPSGKVPILDIDGTVIFESAVINEYINEVYLPSIHPDEALTRATNRAWIEYTSAIYMGFFQWIMADDETHSSSTEKALKKQLAELQGSLQSPYFNGEIFSMVDIAATPIAVRLDIIKNLTQIDILDDQPELKQWFSKLLDRPSVKQSYPSDLNNIIAMLMKGKNSYLLQPKD